MFDFRNGLPFVGTNSSEKSSYGQIFQRGFSYVLHSCDAILLHERVSSHFFEFYSRRIYCIEEFAMIRWTLMIDREKPFVYIIDWFLNFFFLCYLNFIEIFFLSLKSGF